MEKDTIQKREFKFRAWDIIDNNMYDSSGIRNDGMPVDFVDEGSEEIDIEPSWVLMQYTGLKDKNKNDIYESDIVKISGDIIERENPLFVVEWDKYSAKFVMHGCGWESFPVSENIEVMGNIYENPELLK